MSEIVILDGGMGGEISARLEGAGHGLWSAKAMVEAPEVVVEIHREYIDAGADMVMTNTYSTIPHYLSKAGLEDQYVSLTALGGQLARQALEASGKDVLVAGSIPPLHESYRFDLVPPASAAQPVYRNMIEALVPYVDVFICETMSTAEEAHTAVTQALEHGAGKPVYAAWTLAETPGAGLRSGESVAEAFARLEGLGVAGFLFNCTAPEAILAALNELRPLTTLPIGGYANRMNEVDPQWTLDNEIKTGRRQDLGTKMFVDLCERFREAGAQMIGGCCGIGPADISALRERLQPQRG